VGPGRLQPHPRGDRLERRGGRRESRCPCRVSEGAVACRNLAGDANPGRLPLDCDEYSNRYRFRLDFSREFAVHERPVVPYCNVEWFYDTRYDDWARTLLTLGAEVTMTDHSAMSVCCTTGRSCPQEKDLDALGVVLKWYY